MNTDLIRSRIKESSDKLDKAQHEAVERQNQALQDFIIWLCGYMDGIENKKDYTTIKEMLDEKLKGVQ